MPLLDHFHPPLRERRHWTSFHSAWATYIAADLNQHLPERYFAEPHAHFGIEIDVAAVEDSPPAVTREQAVGDAPAGSDVEWTPPAPAQTMSFPLVDHAVEVKIFSTETGPILVGAIELVSPGNKDRPAHREAFVSKCETYLQRAVGLVIVDIVTEHKANLHNELLEHLGPAAASPLGADLYATAYRVVERDGHPSLDIWEETLAVGRPLPTVPLWLQGGLCLPVDLEATYERTCSEQRITIGGQELRRRRRRRRGSHQSQDTSRAIVGVAWYRPEQWERYRELAVDRDSLHETYEEWLASAELHMRRLRRDGFNPRKVDIDLDELVRWCKENQRELDGAARSKFVAEKLRQQEMAENHD